MSKFKLKLEIPGFNEARRSAGVESDLLARGHAVAAAAGGEPDYVVVSRPSASRARVLVLTATNTARRDEAKHRTLTRAFNAARG